MIFQIQQGIGTEGRIGAETSTSVTDPGQWEAGQVALCPADGGTGGGGQETTKRGKYTNNTTLTQFSLLVF